MDRAQGRRHKLCVPAGRMGGEPLDAGDLSQTRHLEAAAIIVIRLLFSGRHPHSVLAFVSPDPR
jgi:predicted dinucleotide-binding enzyme